MKTLYISYCTEYEAGWGQRPDGFAMTEDKETMEEFIKTKGNTGGRDYFWRYDEPTMVRCDDEQYDVIKAKMSEGIAHFHNSDKSKMELFKQI